ncbi:MAG: hypothetical protein ACK5YR_04955 [Pirellula sp.]
MLAIKWQQISMKGLLGLTVIAATFAWLVSWLTVDSVSVTNGYYQWIAGIMVVEHLKQTNDWPKSWDCLKTQEMQLKNTGYNVSLSELEKRVFIDFSADKFELRRQSIQNESVTFDVIRTKVGYRFYPVGNANQLIHDYFRSNNSLTE